MCKHTCIGKALFNCYGLVSILAISTSSFVMFCISLQLEAGANAEGHLSGAQDTAPYAMQFHCGGDTITISMMGKSYSQHRAIG